MKSITHKKISNAPDEIKRVSLVKPNIEISEKNLQEIATLLNTLLADEFVLNTKTRNAHWNIQGRSFMELHLFLEGHYKALDVIIDDIAERVRKLGHFSLGSLNDFLSITHLLENHLDFSDQNQILQALLDDHETIIRIIRSDIAPVAEKHKDLGTTDFVTGVLEQHEKMAWMLRAYIS